MQWMRTVESVQNALRSVHLGCCWSTIAPCRPACPAQRADSPVPSSQCLSSLHVTAPGEQQATAVQLIQNEEQSSKQCCSQGFHESLLQLMPECACPPEGAIDMKTLREGVRKPCSKAGKALHHCLTPAGISATAPSTSSLRILQTCSLAAGRFVFQCSGQHQGT